MSELSSPEEQPKSDALVGEQDDFASLLQREFRPKNDEARDAVQTAVRTLAAQALLGTAMVSDDVARTIEALTAEIDRKLSAQLNEILHCEAFRDLESAWRGLHYLVSHADGDERVKVRVLNVSKVELFKSLKKYKGGAWDQSPLFKKIYEQEFGQFGGEPYGALIGDYYFDHSVHDVELLGQIAKIGASAHAPFISAASPELLFMESWDKLADPRDITKLFGTPDHANWRALRESVDSRYIGLTLPRFMVRPPYGAKTNPVDGFVFEEDVRGGDAERYVWANSAYAMGANIAESFKTYGWCSRIRGVESGGSVTDLPVTTFSTDDGGIDVKCPTEVAISDRREAELSKNGFLPLVQMKGTAVAAFIGAQSLHKPTEYDDPEATANAALAARLPYLFACTRFAHYLKCIVRDKVGSFKDRDEMQRWLTQWILNYVDGMPSHSSERTKAEKPLADASVDVAEVEGSPGYYSAKFYLRPHYQLEGLTVSLRLVSKIPSGSDS